MVRYDRGAAGAGRRSSQNTAQLSDFRRFVLDLAKAEIDQLAAFTMDWSEKRGARGKITHVTLTFTPKDDDATDAAADEAGRHSSGRKARREGTTETIVDTASLIASAASRLSVSDTLRWPADDQVNEFKTPELHSIGMALGGGHSVQRLADQYARVRPEQRRKLVGDALKADWTKWVTGCATKWGRV
ncbi:replication initiation protein [Sphingomonas carotinifaciens]|uniref:replication initiation protein n=1 Tax=Sphingomonas carotinifaciens TaxID=1166323 RepID=UPI002011F4A4|nr:replication initiation protein [Sphingomonas carotinifaciens]